MIFGELIADAEVMSTTQLLIAAIGGLSTAIVVMWVFFQKKFARTEQKLDACEVRHEEANNRMVAQAEEHTKTVVAFAKEVGELRGKMDVLSEQLSHKSDKAHVS